MKNEFIHKYIEDDDRRLSYYVSGNPESMNCIFFFNGLYHGHDIWIKQQRMPMLYSRYKMIFMDYRGLGDSEEKKPSQYDIDDLAEDAYKILELEGFEDITVIGYSAGGIIGVRFAEKMQKYVKRIILLSSALSVSIHALKMMEGLELLIKEGISLETAFALVYPWHHSREYLEKVSDLHNDICEKYGHYNRNTEALMMLNTALKNKMKLNPALKEFFLPTLMIGGDEDVIFPTEFQIETASMIRNCSFRSISGAGHAVHIEKYRETNSIIEEFLSGNLQDG